MPKPSQKRVNPDKAPKERAAVTTARRIVAEIRENRLRPGTKLDAEHVMLERLGVSRGTLREALRFLELQGALRIKAGPGGGPVVSVPGPEHLASVISLQLQFADASFRSVQEARIAIYPVLAAQAARNASHQQIHALHRSVSNMGVHVDSTEALTHELRHFQELVAEASGNTVLGLLVGGLHRMAERAGVVIDPKQRRAAVRASERVLSAIEQGEADRARRETEEMLGAALRYLGKVAPDVLEQPVAWLDMAR